MLIWTFPVTVLGEPPKSKDIQKITDIPLCKRKVNGPLHILEINSVHISNHLCPEYKMMGLNLQEKISSESTARVICFLLKTTRKEVLFPWSLAKRKGVMKSFRQLSICVRRFDRMKYPHDKSHQKKIIILGHWGGSVG